MSVHFVSLRGERTSNEDCHNIEMKLYDSDDKTAKINYYGVYDGHGGKFVSKYLSENIYKYFIDAKMQYPLNKTDVFKIYDDVQNTLFTKYESDATSCGSTCLIVCHFIKNDKNYLNIMNTGDSRCVMCKNNIAVVLTKDHKPDWPDETNRIEQLGGVIRKDRSIYRINDLSVSRAFGDKESSKFVTHRPDIYKYKIGSNDKFIIIACDGLWDVVAPQDAVNFVLKLCYDAKMKRIVNNNNLNIARKLAEHAISSDSGDNVTCIIVFFD